MTDKAKTPATRTAVDPQTSVRSAEETEVEKTEQKAEKPAPEKDSHEDLVLRVERLEHRVL